MEVPCVRVEAVTADWSSLTSLNLSTLDLTRLPSSLLASAAASLASLQLNYCQLTREQVTAVVRAVNRSLQLPVENPEHLEYAILGNPRLTQVVRLPRVTLIFSPGENSL